MRTKFTRATAVAAALLAASLATSSYATTVNIAADNSWHEFDIDDLISQSQGVEWIDAFDDGGQYSGNGSALTFALTLAQSAVVTVVDGGFGGDKFKVTINGQDYFSSMAANTYDTSVGTDFDAALGDSNNFSQLKVTLGAGTYLISGELATSAVDGDGLPLNSTVGGLRVSEVPVPAAAWLFGSALVGLGVVRRRHN